MPRSELIDAAPMSARKSTVQSSVTYHRRWLGVTLLSARFPTEWLILKLHDVLYHFIHLNQKANNGKEDIGCTRDKNNPLFWYCFDAWVSDDIDAEPFLETVWIYADTFFFRCKRKCNEASTKWRNSAVQRLMIDTIKTQMYEKLNWFAKYEMPKPFMLHLWWTIGPTLEIPLGVVISLIKSVSAKH